MTADNERRAPGQAAPPSPNEPSPPLPDALDAATPGTQAGYTGARPIPPQDVHDRAVTHGHGSSIRLLTLTALGVVYGDIGTSPLYAFKESFSPAHGLLPTIPNVYGVLSLIVWSLLLVITVKYVSFVLRADNRGEGGVLSLLALLLQRRHRKEDFRTRGLLIALGLFGAALLYGDGIITPAVSVLSAVEALSIIAPNLNHLVVVAVTVAILIGLFSFQKFGTARVGTFFGPIMLLWFVSMAVLGVMEISREPSILKAVWPGYAVSFFLAHKVGAFLTLGAVVLVVTGGEALYADMGHFGRRPIALAWLFCVFPSLLLNYFGQGALVLRNPSAVTNPFFFLAPDALLIPLVILATTAACIASQALISGAFSLTRQAVQLGYSPRVTIRHTSKKEAGQIYIPEVNKALAIGCVLLVIGFQSSTNLVAAYGIANSGSMAMTSILFGCVVHMRWGWPVWKAVMLAGTFLAIDLVFFAANVPKIVHGGWVPLALGSVIFLLMITWNRGRTLLREILANSAMPLQTFLDSIARSQPHRVSGTAVFMTSTAEGVPGVLLHHLKHNKVLHKQVVLLSVLTAEVPETPAAERVQVEALAHGLYRVRATYGFMQTPDVKEILARCQEAGIETKPLDTSYFLGRERLIPNGPSPMMRWRKKIFVFMSRNARSATEFFGIPPNRVVELGTQIEF